MALAQTNRVAREDDKRIARGDVTRSQIISAAREVLGSVGFSETTVRSVAEQAGVQPSLIHYHFGTMEALFVAVLVQENERLGKVWADIAEADMPLSQKLLATTAYLRQEKTMRHSRQLWELWAASLSNEELATHWRAANEPHRETVKRAVEQWVADLGVVLPVKVDVLVGAYFDFLLGAEIAILGGLSPDAARELKAIEALADLIARVERAHKPSRSRGNDGGRAPSKGKATAKAKPRKLRA
jgi:AcrR family transcriptional regulator